MSEGNWGKMAGAIIMLIGSSGEFLAFIIYIILLFYYFIILYFIILQMVDE